MLLTFVKAPNKNRNKAYPRFWTLLSDHMPIAITKYTWKKDAHYMLTYVYLFGMFFIITVVRPSLDSAMASSLMMKRVSMILFFFDVCILDRFLFCSHRSVSPEEKLGLTGFPLTGPRLLNWLAGDGTWRRKCGGGGGGGGGWWMLERKLLLKREARMSFLLNPPGRLNWTMIGFPSIDFPSISRRANAASLTS